MTPDERAFVKAHHPDRGGDPEAFVAGLAALRARVEPADAPPPDPRFDRPVEFVTTPPLPVRIVIAAIRTARRRARSRLSEDQEDQEHS
ncbi:hypothetical protein [Pseudonocardia oroxyli]|uniref:Uncharacterized protein n=1 Tax=Pseudonocardia oroxyli TaxID=366584 RepID=A0A1G7EA96_PSEOR|nr:hypothetical protein [Pseudonocardia oroxyli]SDE60376.1 hypothetical protein SAMN05216377_101306 [Pseudonocardia oroxyli]